MVHLLHQDLMFGSNELIYVAGSSLPIMIEELEEEEYENDTETPSVPPRAPKVARTRTPEPKISFSYTHDPRVTPTRKTSTLSNASLTVQYNDINPNQDVEFDESPPKTLPRKKAKSKIGSVKDIYEETPVATPRTKPKTTNEYASISNKSPKNTGERMNLSYEKLTTNQDKKVSISVQEEDLKPLTPPPRRYATIPRRNSKSKIRAVSCR